MNIADDLARSRDIARRFLQTAVVVDDEAYLTSASGESPSAELVAPTRHSRGEDGPHRRQVRGQTKHTLNAGHVIDSFAALGMVCGVIGPSESALETLRRADIVVLDWRLQKDDPDFALGLLRDLLTAETDRNSLRLVAIYTGEGRLEDICDSIVRQLKATGLQPDRSADGTTISYRHGRVVLYAKSEVNLANHLKDRSIAEKDLPERLVSDFAIMTQGLLPGIALTSLTAVREGAHRVLDQFSADLDPAFLAHRVCLSNADDAERHIVNHVAEELRGLMDNAVAAESPGGASAVEGWIRLRDKEGRRFAFGTKGFDLQQTIALARGGLERSELKNNAFEELAAGFAGGDAGDLNERLAWIMSFRTVFNAPPPRLWLGSVVTGTLGGEEKHLICMRPRCDCVRLGGKTSFFFLPLVAPRKVKEQVVVKLGPEFKRLGIGQDPGGWVHREFEPTNGKGEVIAAKDPSSSRFVFMDTRKERFTWQGELKAEFAQRIVHTFTTRLDRVAVDESEWLRRVAGK